MKPPTPPIQPIDEAPMTEGFIDARGNMAFSTDGLLKELHIKEQEGLAKLTGANTCPECKEGYMIYQSGCKTCWRCGYSPCK